MGQTSVKRIFAMINRYNQIEISFFQYSVGPSISTFNYLYIDLTKLTQDTHLYFLNEKELALPDVNIVLKKELLSNVACIATDRCVHRVVHQSIAIFLKNVILKLANFINGEKVFINYM